jgi:hypothetical protein
MAIPGKQIGWSNESNLIWEISKQLEQLINISYNLTHTTTTTVLPTTTTTTTTIAPPPPLVWINPCPTVVNLTVGVPVTLQVNQLTGGTPPYTYNIFPSITPPAGLSWNSATCTLSGTPTVTGTFGGKLINALDSGIGAISCGLTIIVS